jgi:polysaccharide export outer membrane protein
MKGLTCLILLTTLIFANCSSTKNLNYLGNLPETSEAQYFPYEMPDYKIQYRDILYIEAKIQNQEGKIEDLLQGNSSMNAAYIGAESSQYILGYNVDEKGFIHLPVIGKISVGGKTLTEVKLYVQEKVDSIFRHTFIDVKLLSFKYTVLGEAKNPGTYINYNNFLTVLEAIGRAGGVGDYGRRDRVLVIRSTEGGTKTFRVDLKDKSLLSSEAYFMMPNDVVIIEPVKHKIFNMNLPTYTFALTSITSIITMTLLLIEYFK